VVTERAGVKGAFDLLICDCDGVLIDSEIIADRVLYNLVGDIFPGREVASVLANSFGRQTRDILQRLATHLGEPLPANFFDQLRQALKQALNQEAKPIAGVREALAQIDLPIAVASNSNEAWVRISIERAGIDDLIGDRVFTAEKVARPKPAPDVYLLAARTLHVAPARCLVIEDSESGVTAALAAGMSVIGFVGASHIPSDHADRLTALGARLVLDHMDLLPAAVASLRFTQADKLLG
jgi:HAD superfamily hydrolase (TIGR01509 family)